MCRMAHPLFCWVQLLNGGRAAAHGTAGATERDGEGTAMASLYTGQASPGGTGGGGETERTEGTAITG